MRRRDFIVALGGAAASWPLAGHAQERGRHIGVLSALAADNPENQTRIAAFLQGLQELGWTAGRNVRIDYRLGGGDAEHMRRHAAELIALAPDVVLANGTTAVEPLLQATRSVPIVFVQVSDPVGAGYVASLARPGGNATGFALFEYGMSGKWLELLKQVAPRVTRAAVLRDATTPTGIAQLAAMHSVAPSLGVVVSPLNVRDAADIERGVAAFAREANGGLIVAAGAQGMTQRDLIVALADRHRLPAVYPQRFYVAGGGLMSYGTNSIDMHQRAAGYVDRILKGAKPADLPVQNPTKFELVINLKTAKALGLTVPPIAARARRRGDRIGFRMSPIEYRGGLLGLLGLDARELDHFRPLFRIFANELAEIGGRAGKGGAAKTHKSFLEHGVNKNGVDLLVEPVDDFGRRVLGGADAHEPDHFVALHKFAHGRNIGQNLNARRTGHRQRPQPARLDVWQRRRHGVEHDMHLTGDQPRERRHRALVGYVHHVDAGHHPQHLAGQMTQISAPARSHVELAGVGLRIDDELRQRLGRQRWVYNQDKGVTGRNRRSELCARTTLTCS